VEVGGHMKICPIVVENLRMNGQMLIEVCLLTPGREHENILRISIGFFGPHPMDMCSTRHEKAGENPKYTYNR